MASAGGRGLLLLLLSFGSVLVVESSCFPAIFNFGDSTSDTGGIHASFPTSTPAEYLPYGENLPNGVNHYRYSDGLLLIDYMTKALGIPYLDPYLQSVTSSFSNGANFATAGATARQVTYLSPFTLPIQVKQYQEFKANVAASLATRPGNSRLTPSSYFSNGLYIIAIGGNDFTYGYTQGLTTSQVEQYLPEVVTAITDAIQGLYRYGARHFIIHDVEPQGCLPYTLTLIPHSPSDLDANGCLIAYNAAAQYYNQLLRTALVELQPQVPSADLIFLSFYTIKYNLLSNYTKNGFLYTTRACCGVPSAFNYNPRINCGGSGTVNGVQLASVTCTNPSEYIVWDGVHNTQAANKYFAEQILSGNFFSPYFPKLTQNCGLSPL